VAREWEIDPLDDDNHDDDDVLSNDFEVGNQERHSLAESFFDRIRFFAFHLHVG
jgi:hypothetical protein